MPGYDPGTQAYLQHAREINPHISETQFQHTDWRNAYDPQGCPPNKPFHSIKQGGDNACVEQPDNCPEGKQAFGANECRGHNERGMPGYGQSATGAAAATPAAPVAPTTFGHAGELSYTGNPLTDALLYQFNSGRSLQTGQGNIFGGLPGYGAGATGQGAAGTDLTGKLLSGGGLAWGLNSAFGANQQAIGEPVHQTSAPPPSPTQVPRWSGSNNPYPEVSAEQPLGLNFGSNAPPGLGVLPGAPVAQPSSPLSGALTQVPQVQAMFPRPKYRSLQEGLMGGRF